MKKAYRKPEVVVSKEIEALAGTCQFTNGGNTGDKDNTCTNPVT